MMSALQTAMLALAMPAVVPEAIGTPIAAPYPFVMSERMPISKSEWNERWPFSIDAGTLTCIAFGGQRYVFFAEVLSNEEMGEYGAMTLPRSVAVSTNPFVLFGTEDKDLYLPFGTLETLITRMGPIEALGTTLCEKAKQSPEPEL